MLKIVDKFNENEDNPKYYIWDANYPLATEKKYVSDYCWEIAWLEVAPVVAVKKLMSTLVIKTSIFFI